MKVPFADLKRQYRDLKPEIDAAIQAVIDETAFVGGETVRRFEQNFAKFCGAKHCIGVANGTDSLSIALKAMGIGAGDEVIVPANSFIATSEAVSLTGARVVFCDVDARRYTMDPVCLRALVSPRTKAVIPVHLYGCPADMDAILAVARDHGLRVIEDSAQAHGAEYKGCRIGTLGDVASFSFYPGKNLGAYGDAGALVTNDDSLALKMRMIKDHGRTGKYDHEIEGVNSRLDGIQAAVLDAKLPHLAAWSRARLENAWIYNQALSGIGDIVVPLIPEDSIPVFHLYVIRCSRRDELQAFLKDRGVATGVHYPIALPNLKAYAYLGHRPGDFPVASSFQNQILSLPMFPELEPAAIAYVAAQIREFCNGSWMPDSARRSL